MVTRLVATTDGALWDRLVRTVGGGTGFHDWDWLQLAGREFPWRFHPLLVERDGVAVGVFPVLVEPGIPPHSVRPPFPFVGPLVPADVLPDALVALRRWQLRHGVPRIRFEFAPEIDVRSALEAAGCTWEPDSSFVIALEDRTEADLRAGMTRRGQRALKRAVAAGVEVRQSLPGEIADMLPRLFDEAWAARDLPTPYPPGISSELERIVSTDPAYYATTAVLEGKPVGLQVALVRHDTVYCWGGGALRDYRDQQPFTMVAFDLFCWALEHGFRAVDMVGRVDEGVATFKRSIGGTEVPYLIAASTMVPAPILGVTRALRGRGTAAETAAPAVEVDTRG